MTNKKLPVRFQHTVLLYEHVDIIQNKNIDVFYKAVINMEFMCRNPHECPEIKV